MDCMVETSAGHFLEKDIGKDRLSSLNSSTSETTFTPKSHEEGTDDHQDTQAQTSQKGDVYVVKVRDDVVSQKLPFEKS